MLPLGPPDRHLSPYKARSAFAAFNGLLASPDAPVSRDEIASFRERHAFWARSWERGLADQVRFEREWGELRAYAAGRGVGLIGDVPIYVAPGSADVRTWPELFADGVVAGVPPDAFTDEGQLWGNPLYDWPALRRRGYRWWTERFRRTSELFDLFRIDHFRGFVAYWAVPEGARTAASGRWVRGPGRAVFDAAERELGPLSVIAEDLGVITPPVRGLREALGYPGMVVVQFAFDPEDPESPHEPHNHASLSVVYTGTHDTDTLAGWWAGLPEAFRERAFAEGMARDEEPHWALIRLAMSSPAVLAMMQVQDVLGLGSDARMNVPGRAAGNWRWRLQPGALTAELASRLRAETAAAGRLAG
jgi:4-alpha-glucanotransferase